MNDCCCRLYYTIYTHKCTHSLSFWWSCGPIVFTHSVRTSEWRPAQSRNELKAQQDNKEWQWLGYDSGCYWSFFYRGSCRRRVCHPRTRVPRFPSPRTHTPIHPIQPAYISLLTYRPNFWGSGNTRKLNLLPLAKSREIRAQGIEVPFPVPAVCFHYLFALLAGGIKIE